MSHARTHVRTQVSWRTRAGGAVLASLRWSGISLVLLLAVAVAVLALSQYAFYDPATDTRPAVNFVRHPVAIVFHAVGASCAPFIGLLQLSTRLRRRWRSLHRWLGRFYLVVCVGIGGTAGLWLAFFAYGGAVARVGLGLIAVLWFGTSGMAYLAIRAGDVRGHREWMWRSVAVALGGITLRVYLPILVTSGVSFLVAYRIVTWASWLPNLMLAEYLVRRSRSKVVSY